MPPRLLALDLDGTLLREDGTLTERDAAAVRQALEAGVAVTLATGRLATGALPSARALKLQAPLVCADGVVLACAETGSALEQTPLPLDVADEAVAVVARHGLAPFAFVAAAIHGPSTHEHVCRHLRSWTEQIVLHAEFARADAWRGEGVASVFGVGEAPAVHAAADAIEAALGAAVEVARFTVGGENWAVRVRPPGCDKAVLLARLAERLGVNRADVCAVGDWYNDIPMLAWAGRSFAMADAPEDVRAAARETVAARRGQGGGVAEAVARWLETR